MNIVCYLKLGCSTLPGMKMMGGEQGKRPGTSLAIVSNMQKSQIPKCSIMNGNIKTGNNRVTTQSLCLQASYPHRARNDSTTVVIK